jgi:hypothetical protein
LSNSIPFDAGSGATKFGAGDQRFDVLQSRLATANDVIE